MLRGARRDGEPRLRGLQSRPGAHAPSQWGSGGTVRSGGCCAGAPGLGCWGFGEGERWEQAAPGPFKELLSSAKVRWYHLGTRGRLGSLKPQGWEQLPWRCWHSTGAVGGLPALKGGSNGILWLHPAASNHAHPSPVRPNPISGGF